MILARLIIGLYRPPTLVVTLMVFLIFVRLLLVFILSTYFYSYLVFLLFTRGVVIIIIYLCGVLIIDRSVSFNWLIVCLSVTASLCNPLLESPLVPGLTESYKIVFHHDFYSINKFLWYPFSVVFMAFIIYLFACLIIVYEIVKKCEGPLRIKI